MVGAFFDVDGTLYRANMWRGLMQYAQEHGRARSARIYGLAHMPLFYLRQLKLLSEEDFRRPWVANLGWMIRGWSEAEGQAAWDWIAEKYLRPTALHDTLARLAEHIAQKHVVVLVSAMLAPCLETLARPLNVTGTVGTATEIRDGKYTGRIPPPVVMGIEKDARVSEIVRLRSGFRGELRLCRFDQRPRAVRDGRASGGGLSRPGVKGTRADAWVGDHGRIEWKTLPASRACKFAPRLTRLWKGKSACARLEILG
jgi:phosphoserine phosphatase